MVFLPFLPWCWVRISSSFLYRRNSRRSSSILLSYENKRKFENQAKKLTCQCCMLYWGLTPLLQLRLYHGSRWHTCVSWLSHTSTNTTFLSKATDCFSHMLLQRWEAKIRQKEKSPQLPIKLPTTRSRVRHTQHWDTPAGCLTYQLLIHLKSIHLPAYET